MSDGKRIASVEGENRQLRQALDMELTQLALLREQVQELEARLARDSHTAANRHPATAWAARPGARV
jgi:hypothetical protein